MKPLNSNTIIVRINDETPVSIAPKFGHKWTGKDIYSHLNLLGLDLDGFLFMTVHPGYPDEDNVAYKYYRWETNGTKVEASIPTVLDDLLHDYYFRLTCPEMKHLFK